MNELSSNRRGYEQAMLDAGMTPYSVMVEQVFVLLGRVLS